MTLDAVMMGVGAFIALLPFLGFPSSWHTSLLIIAGVVVIALGVVVRRRGVPSSPPHSFVESTPRSTSSAAHETQEGQ